MTSKPLTPEHGALLSATIDHFREIARQNRFPENNAVEHDNNRCVVCHPELLPLDPFVIYLDVVTQSIKVRRPRLDQELVDEINGDLSLQGLSSKVTLDGLRAGGQEALEHWSNWVRSALATGLDLLSIHSATSREFDLDEAETGGWADAVEGKVRELMEYQRENC